MFILFSAIPLHGQFSYTETFRGITADGWTFGQGNAAFSPELTAATGLDAVGDGRLRLTTASGNQHTFAYLDNPIASAGNNITVEFEYAVSGGTGADGISFFFTDATVPFSLGADGGALGYTGNNSNAGLAGGYLGIGIDTYGNFGASTEGRNGGTPGLNPDQVTVRGDEASNYQFIAGTNNVNTTGDGTTGSAGNPIASLGASLQSPTRDDFFSFRINLSSDDLLTVSFDETGTGFTDLFTTDVSGFTRPNDLLIGFSASTGGQNNIHEIRGLGITTTAQPIGTTFWDGEGNDGDWSTATNWVGDIVPVDYDDIFFDVDAPGVTQTIDTNTDRIIRSINFDSDTDYVVNNNTLIFDTDQGGNLAINVSNENGDSDLTINSNIDATGDFSVIQESLGEVILNGAIDQNGNTIFVSGTGATTVNGSVTGGGDLEKDGTGVLTLDGANNEFDSVTLNEGSIEANSTVAMNIGQTGGSNTQLGEGPITVNDGDLTAVANGTLNLHGSITLENGTVNLTSNTEDVNFRAGSSYTQNGGITNIDAGQNGGDNFIQNSSSVLDINGGDFNIVDSDDADFNGTTTVDDANFNLTIRDRAFIDGAFTANNSNVTLDADDDVLFRADYQQTNGNLNTSVGDDISIINDATFTLDNVTGSLSTNANNRNNFLLNTGTSTNASMNINNGSDLEITAYNTLFSGNVNVANSDLDVNASNFATFDEELNVDNSNVLISAEVDIRLQNSAKVILNSGTLDFATNQDSGDDFTASNGTEITVNGGAGSIVADDAQFAGDVNLNNGDLSIDVTTDVEFTSTSTLSVADGEEIVINADDQVILAGTADLNNNGQINVQTGDTLLDSTANVTGGEIVMNENLIVDGATLSNTDITMTASSDNSISGETAGGSVSGIDTLTLNNDPGVTTTIESSIGTISANDIDLIGGTLLLGGDDKIGDSTNINLLGGDLDTNGFDDEVGELSLSGNSNLTVGGNTIRFDSAGDFSGTLSIVGWDGNTDIFVTAGIDLAKLTNVVFINPQGFAPGVYESQLTAANEIIPVPEVSQIIGGIGLLSIGGIYLWRRRKSLN